MPKSNWKCGFYTASRALGRPTWLFALCGFAGVVAVIAYRRSATIRQLFVWSAITLVLVPINFLLFTPTRSIFVTSGEAPGATSPFGAPTLEQPVVLLVFDSLGLPVLLDENGEIDRDLFPNFARLADTSTWFRSATTNYGSTEKSVHALLTGKFQPDEGASSSYRQQPTNLFTLVTAPTGVFAVEPATQLCPPDVCVEEEATEPAFPRKVLADLWLVYQNTITPDFLISNVRPLPQRWSNLAEEPKEQENDTAGLAPRSSHDRVDAFCAEIRPERSRSLFFLHMVTPHAPYDRNPDGRSYHKAASYDMIAWVSDNHSWRADAEFQVVQAYQRHVSQTRYADGHLGKVIARLHETGLFERAHVVVVSDHGSSFEPGRNRRASKLGKPALIANISVPFFWKTPRQTQPVVSDRVAELVDMVPTMLRELGGSDPDGFDGTPLFSDRHRRSRRFENEDYNLDPWPGA